MSGNVSRSGEDGRTKAFESIIFVFEAHQSQMLSDGHEATVNSNCLNLGPPVS